MAAASPSTIPTTSWRPRIAAATASTVEGASHSASNPGAAPGGAGAPLRFAQTAIRRD